MRQRQLQSKIVGISPAATHARWLTYPEPMPAMSEDEGDADDEPDVKIDEEKNESAR